jgi:SAM-dependent methyltransferase
LLGRYAEVSDWRFGTGATADVYWCARCGALGPGRIPPPEEIASWYAGYYTHRPEHERTGRWPGVWPTRRRRRELDGLRRYLTPPGTTGRFLDVGTGSGERLLEFAAAGWEVVGQDIDPEAGRVAREHGIEVHSCPVPDLVGVEEPFDLIGLNHVLEHVPDPAELLRACGALLTPAGRICVVAPNAQALGRLLFGRWWFGLEQPRHLAVPTRESLERLAPRVPLRVVDAATTAANAAVLLGGSLARPIEERLPPGPLRRGATSAMHVLGQALGRAAVTLDARRGEEIVWVGQWTGT